MDKEKVIETIKKVEINKADDWWAKHNLTSRIISLSSVFLFIIVVVYGLLGNENLNYELILVTLSDVTLYVTLAIILGVNGLSKVFDSLAKLKK
jgi:hypothetical protein